MPTKNPDGSDFHLQSLDLSDALDNVSETWKPFRPHDVAIDYTNRKGIRRWRIIRPLRIEFCATEWHRKTQWMVVAVDLEDADMKAILPRWPIANINQWRALS